MNILVTGASGFLGKNLICQLYNSGYENIFKYDKDTDIELLDKYCETCDFVFHLAGVNRPENTDEFSKQNTGFTHLSSFKNKESITFRKFIIMFNDKNHKTIFEHDLTPINIY